MYFSYKKPTNLIGKGKQKKSPMHRYSQSTIDKNNKKANLEKLVAVNQE